ncbi:hypothetical protein C5167_001516 [Papaver somniferum]|uniref:Uncharacterized protein n=1 Tax=Papaver somniferum TaxID=3469 RepID=A0A4Y7KWT1_PAPSO|nr:uncharacterized protein LOC113313778 [Papaver somniferum]RZC77346.1 hypothetical protein C5167_001516 [Papaver somniferum]
MNRAAPAATAPRLELRTTAQLIKQTSVSFSTSLYTFLFLSLLLFFFRTSVENGTLIITSFIDRDPSLKALLSRIDLSGRNLKSSNTEDNSFSSSGSTSSGGGGTSRSNFNNNRGRRRRRPFLHLSRVGTLDDDFFSNDDDIDNDRGLFGFGKKGMINVTTVNLSYLFRGSDYDDGVMLNEIVASGGFQFKDEGLVMNDGGGVVGNEEEEGDFQFFMKGLELGRRDAAALFFLVSFLSVAYGWVILGYLVTHSCILGIVFFVVVNNHLGKHVSFMKNVWGGSKLGVRRVSGFILMRWAVRDAMTQLLGLWFFSEIEDQHSFFKLFIRLKLMPFSVTSPWIVGYETQISGFLFTWFLLDVVVALVFAVDSWVAIMDIRMSGKEIVREGCYLISTMMNQAIQLKCYEAILCGSFVRWILVHSFGNIFASAFQSIVEVYFMVAWLIYYFAARCRGTSSDGRRFGRRDLEDYINALR